VRIGADAPTTVRDVQKSAVTSGRDSVHQYLQEIGRHALLSAEEERHLAAIVQSGQAARMRLSGDEDLSAEERSELRRVVQDGDDAARQFAVANLRLVVSVAKRYQWSGVPLLDLIEDGNLGLLKAVEKYDGTQGYKFSTYAVWWIRQAIVRGIEGSARMIRVPSHAHSDVVCVRRTADTLEKELHRRPTPDELVGALGWGKDQVTRALRVPSDPVSLDVPLSGDSDDDLGSMVEDDGASDPGDVATSKVVSDTVLQLLEQVNERERTILRLRFGLGNDDPHTLAEIADMVGTSRERIRQLEARALEKLRGALDAREVAELLAC
jgi:RNA polymerase sigma factor (sigma-70 family)